MNIPQAKKTHVLINRDQHPPAALAKEYMDAEEKIKEKQLAVEISRTCIASLAVDEVKAINQIEELGVYNAPKKIRPMVTYGGSIANFLQ